MADSATEATGGSGSGDADTTTPGTLGTDPLATDPLATDPIILTTSTDDETDSGPKPTPGV